MKRFNGFFTLICLVLLSLMLAGCEHNVYIPDYDIWMVSGVYFSTVQKAVDYVISGGSSKAVGGTDGSHTVYLMTDVLEGSFPEALRQGLTVPAGYNGDLCVDFNGHEYDFSSNVELFFNIQGGNKIEIINGTSVIFEDSVSENKALIVNTNTVTIDEHLIDDRRKTPQAVEVQDGGKLEIISSESTVTGTVLKGEFSLSSGGSLLISGSTVVIDNLNAENDSRISVTGGTVTFNAIEAADAFGFTITGGTIYNPHTIDTEINTAIGSHTADVNHIVIHEFEFESSEVTQEATCTETGVRTITYCCKTCGETKIETEIIPKIPHTDKWHSDANYHWDICSVCGEVLHDKTHHRFERIEGIIYCVDCGYIPDENELNSGFDVTPKQPEPSGYITSEFNSETGTLTFTFVSTNAGSVPTEFSWYVDNVLQNGETESTFSLLAKNEGCTVMCIFWNSSGVGSAAADIN